MKTLAQHIQEALKVNSKSKVNNKEAVIDFELKWDIPVQKLHDALVDVSDWGEKNNLLITAGEGDDVKYYRYVKFESGHFILRDQGNIQYDNMYKVKDIILKLRDLIKRNYKLVGIYADLNKYNKLIIRNSSYSDKFIEMHIE